MSDVKVNEKGYDYLFLTEIMNDLHRHGFIQGGKAETMLKDWKRELRIGSNFPKSRQRKVHAAVCGAVNWNR